MAGEPEPTVSVVITAFNCAQYLAQAIDSVLRQTRPAGQVIVLDDGSTDHCAEVARAYADRLEYIYQPNQGIAAARNAGAQRTSGAWLAFQDGDDYWELDKLERQLAAAADDPSREAIFGQVEQFYSPELTPAQRAQFGVPPGLMPGYYAGAMLIRRESLERVGAFELGWRRGDFLAWYTRAVDAGLAMWMLPERVVWRRVHLTNSSRRVGHSIEYVRLLKASLDRRRAQRAAGGDPA